MKYVCDAADKKTWFRIESEAEAEKESELMDHAVAKHFAREKGKATQSYKPTSTVGFEQNIGLRAHIQRQMPLFLTLRNSNGDAHITAMLPPEGQMDAPFGAIIVGKSNSDPYPDHAAAIAALGTHFGLTLDRASCYPYAR